MISPSRRSSGRRPPPPLRDGLDRVLEGAGLEAGEGDETDGGLDACVDAEREVLGVALAGGRTGGGRSASRSCAAGTSPPGGLTAAGGAFPCPLVDSGTDTSGAPNLAGGERSAHLRRARLGLDEVAEAEMDQECQHDAREEEDHLLRLEQDRAERR